MLLFERTDSIGHLSTDKIHYSPAFREDWWNCSSVQVHHCVAMDFKNRAKSGMYYLSTFPCKREEIWCCCFQNWYFMWLCCVKFPVGGRYQGHRKQTSSLIFGVLASWSENCIFCFAETWWMWDSVLSRRENGICLTLGEKLIQLCNIWNSVPI